MTALHSAVVSSRGSRRPGARQAVDAREVARVGELPGQADRRVEPGLEVLDEPAVAVATLTLVRSCDHVGLARAWPAPARTRGSSASSTPAARHASRALGVSPSALDDGEQLPALQEREPARAEVVEQRAERLRAQRDLRRERARPGRASAMVTSASVDAAHAVDGDVLDEQVLDQSSASDGWIDVSSGTPAPGPSAPAAQSNARRPRLARTGHVDALPPDQMRTLAEHAADRLDEAFCRILRRSGSGRGKPQSHGGVAAQGGGGDAMDDAGGQRGPR